MDSLSSGKYPRGMSSRHVGLVERWADEAGIVLRPMPVAVDSLPVARSVSGGGTRTAILLVSALAVALMSLVAALLMGSLLGLLPPSGISLDWSFLLFWMLVALSIEVVAVARTERSR